MPRTRQPHGIITGSRRGDESASTPPENDQQQKRARKRATDRVAQQEHRKRQKLYVEQLEAKVAFMLDDSSTDRVTTLLRENEALREELQQLKTFFNSVSQLVRSHSPNNAALRSDQTTAGKSPILVQSQETASHSPLQQTPQADRLGGRDVDLPPSDGTNGTNVGLDDPCGLMGQFETLEATLPELELDNVVASSTALTQREPSARWPCTSNTGVDISWSPRLPAGFSFPEGDPSWSELLPLYASVEPPIMSSRHMSGQQSTWNHDAAKLRLHDLQQQFESRGRSWEQLEPFPLRPQHLRPPHLPQFVSPSDAILLKFLRLYESTSRQVVARKASKPSVEDFLVHGSSDPLSAKIKAYIAPITKFCRVPETLASYWIISLFTRWYIQRDEASYNDMPVWLRPTELQRSVSHPMALWFMPWPEIRDAAISMSLLQPGAVEDIMVSLGQFMEVDLSGIGMDGQPNTAEIFGVEEVAFDTEASFIGGLDNRSESDRIHKAIRDLRNWRLHEGFFARYPEWRRLYNNAREQLDPLPFQSNAFQVEQISTNHTLFT